MRLSACAWVVALLCGIGGLAGCSAHATEVPAASPDADRQLPAGVVRIAEASRPFIAVEAAQPDASAPPLRAPARVEFRDDALSRLAAPLSGRVVAVHVKTGDRVTAGQALVDLDCPDAAAARSGIDSVTATLREARAALARERRMLDEGVGIERDALAAETRVAELESDLARARAGAAFVGPGSGALVVLRAPLSGTVIARRATEGMAVQQGGDPLVEIGNPSALWIVADVFERDLPLVREGASARIDLPAAHDTLDGRIASIGPIIATGARTAPIRITLSSDGRVLRPGMYGRAEIAIPPATGSLTLPAEAVLVKGHDTIVYVERDRTTFTRRAIVVAQPVGGRVQVLSGISPGERIVVRGALLLDGAADQLM